MKDYFVFSVGDLGLLAEHSPERAERIRESLGTFSCKRSSNIEDFIHGNMENSERWGESRSFLILEKGTDRLLGFFTLGLTTVSWNDVQDSDAWRQGVSGKKRKRMAKGLRVRDGHIGVYTIGELARADGVSSEELPGMALLDEAVNCILAARSRVGGRFVLVDSRPVLYERLYSRVGFTEFSRRESPNNNETEEFIVSLLFLGDLGKD